MTLYDIWSALENRCAVSCENTAGQSLAFYAYRRRNYARTLIRKISLCVDCNPTFAPTFAKIACWDITGMTDDDLKRIHVEDTMPLHNYTIIPRNINA